MTIVIWSILYLIIGIYIGDSALTYGKKVDPEFNKIVVYPKSLLLVLALFWPLILIVVTFKK